MLPLIFILLAAICKAGADTLSHHFGSSIFKKWNPKIWDASISWMNKYDDAVNMKRKKNYTVKLKKLKFKIPALDFYSDGWHLFNSGMIVCFCLAAIAHRPLIWWGWELLIAGLAFNLCFNIFYNKILR